MKTEHTPQPTVIPASLIAAAPDLLDALKVFEAMDDLHDRWKNEPDKPDSWIFDLLRLAGDARAKMRAAISKAESK